MPRAHEVFARARHDCRWPLGTSSAVGQRWRAKTPHGVRSWVLCGAVVVFAGCGRPPERGVQGDRAQRDEGGSPASTGAPESPGADVRAAEVTGSAAGEVGEAADSTGGVDDSAPAFTPLIRELLGSEDARAVPEGTPPAVAATFKRIPLTVSDHGPVSGIGESGLHVDRMSLGTVFRKNRCRKPLERYAVSSGEDISFCFRAVHRRIDETITVHWRRQGRLVRRSFVNIPAIHAYRTRAKLALRREYVGWWDVIAMAADGTEIARTRFEVVE